VKRLGVIQEAGNELVIAKMVDRRPQERPADSDAEEHDKVSFQAGFVLVVRHDVCSMNCDWDSIHDICTVSSESVLCDGSNAVA
jgi:hypothetical protein